MKSVAEQLVAHAIPLPGRRREEFLGLGATIRERALQPALVQGRSPRRAHLLAHEQPQAPGRSLKLVARRHRVDVARAFRA
jgi:hypothetical protein